MKRYPTSKVRESGQGHEKGSDLISGPRSVQPSVLSDSVTPWGCSMPGLPVHHQLPEPAQSHGHPVGDAIQPSHPLSYPSPPAFNLSQVLSNESILPIRFPKYWSFSLSINPSNEYPGLIYFWIDWFDLLTVQGTLKSLLQHHS